MSQSTPKGNPQAQMTAAMQAAFLAVFRISGIVTLSCERSGVGRSTVYAWLEKDQNFAAQFTDAAEEAADRAEAEAWRRAVDGFDRPLIGRVSKDRDGIVAFEREYSDRLLERVLEARRPSLDNRRRVELTGANGGPVQFAALTREAIAKLTPDEQQQFRALLAKMAGAEPKQIIAGDAGE